MGKTLTKGTLTKENMILGRGIQIAVLHFFFYKSKKKKKSKLKKMTNF